MRGRRHAVLILAAIACSSASAASPGRTVAPTVETDPVPHGGDAADDPAIWIHPSRPALSTVIGTDKQGGIAVYDVSGRQIQYRADGELNNVDLRSGFPLGGKRVTLVAASNRSNDSIAIYRVDVPTRTLSPVSARTIALGIAAYGSCMYRSPRTRKVFVFVDSEDGEVEQWLLFARGRRIDARRVRSFDVGSQTEGCVADDRRGHLYIGEEEKGIWRYGAEPGAGQARTLVDSAGSAGHLTADVEGLTIAYGPGRRGYLLASSQGSDSFVVYRLAGNNAYVDSFRIGAGGASDGVEETDGIDVATASLGPRFPKGVFVAQDGRNDDGRQNYKLVPWQGIIRE
jgi:3-phytase